MNDERTAVFAGVVSLLVLALQAGPVLLLQWWTTRGFEGIPSVFETIGMTYVAYIQMLGLLVGILGIALSIGLGYYVGPRLDVPSEFDRFVSAVGLGSVGGVLLGGLVFRTAVFVLQGPGTVSLDAFTLFVTVIGVLRLLVEVSLPVTVGAIAGIAIYTFRTEGMAPPPASPGEGTGPS